MPVVVAVVAVAAVVVVEPVGQAVGHTVGQAVVPARGARGEMEVAGALSANGAACLGRGNA